MRRLLLAFLLLLTAFTAVAEVAVPPLTGRVVDLAGVLQPAEQAALASRLAAFEQEKGSQIAVLIVPTTQPESIEQFGIRVVDQWKLGRQGVDDGLLILLAMEDRSMRIEVGYGLEGVIPDAIAKRVIAEIMTPYFRQGDFYGGLNAAVEQLIALVDGEPLPAPAGKTANSGASFEDMLPLLLFGAIAVGGVLRAIFGRFVGGAIGGGLVGMLVWLLGGGVLFALVLAIIAFIMTLSGGMGGGGVGGGFGRGGMGGGGFSGGGGGFGGGGASGRW